MDFDLTPIQRGIRDLSRKFAQQEIAPIAAQHDESGQFPSETVKKMGALGLMGLEIPREFGGADVDTLSYALAVEE
ncbi:MAG: acyl-CoA dehydrogenase family protein, partial [bacterium]